jgi:ribose transport system permease protein
VNVWGTIIGVLILGVGISGIQQLGGAFFIEPLFNGLTLLVSIALAGFAQRRRSVVRRPPSIQVPVARTPATSQKESRDNEEASDGL